ncbi:MAG TPA: cytosine permease, partial [Candidatus Dormibacteraeota bacterium]|nr:cytosine permease [Candidatus Dormibacteraeota bacterium]
MASATSGTNEIVYPDGRRELRDASEVEDSPLYNNDLAPVPVARRTWNTYNYSALWIGMAHNIPTYLLASGLITLGMAWYQAIITIALGNLIVLIPMLLNSHGGTKYGIPYPVLARASFG